MTPLLQASIPKNVTLRYQLAPYLPFIEADSTQLRQVLMNLIVNAAEAINDAEGSITMSTGVRYADRAALAATYLTPDLPAGEYVYLEVADTGSGMDALTQERIFDPFFTTKFTGRGLGLAAVLGIVRSHHGGLHVQSTPGQGTTLTVLLPTTATAAEAGASDLSAPTAWRTGDRVLVIDDEEAVRKIAARILEHFGFTALTAADGREGIALFRVHADSITCVLLDLTMPHMSGEAVFHEIRRIKPTARVVLMSGYNEQEALQRFVGRDLTGFLQKPFGPSDLRDALYKALAESG
jgi:CheY-like chemotaxis protein